MLRQNLSTRPFYNERLVHLLIALAGLVVLGVTLANILRLVPLSMQNKVLAAQVAHDRAEAARLTSEAATIRRGLDPAALALVAGAAREANSLIDQRTFSWTEFFNRIEDTIPPDVMLTSVRPAVDKTGTRVSMVVVGKTSEDLDEFMEKLEATGAFEDILPRQQDRTDDGYQQSVVDARYTPEHADDEAEPAEPAAPQRKAPPGRTSAAREAQAGTASTVRREQREAGAAPLAPALPVLSAAARTGAQR